VLVALGNCSNDELLPVLDLSFDRVAAELTSGARLVVVHPARLEILG
jgi:hypothetical protein